VILISFILSFLLSIVESGSPCSSSAVVPLPDHSIWTAELKKYVSADGQVNYAAWEKDQAALDRYLAQLASTQPLSNWSTNVQLAYWINVYNAFTVKLILEHYPVQSIKDIQQGNPWDHLWINLGGKTYSLNQIENEFIIQRFRDPRIHFALNCGARSCPPLLNEAYEPARLDVQLTTRTASFITNPQFNQLNVSPARISLIFEWYKADFKPDVISFLNTYTPAPISTEMALDYLPYDWALNGK
jgi:hypothetical protein